MRLKLQQGFTLIELMISSVIGIVLLGGIMNVFVSSREVYHASASQRTLITDASFAIHLIRQDIQMAGSFGLVGLSTGSIKNTLPSIAGDCAPKWYTNTSFGVMGFNDINPYSATCITSTDGYVPNTDILVVRYAESEVKTNATVKANTLYIRTTASEGELFIGSKVPVLVTEGGARKVHNNKLQSVAYYISDHTDSIGDKYPSLRRIRLRSGPVLEDEVVVPGVQDMQIQYGFDADEDGSVDQYLNADNAAIVWGDPDTQKKLLSISISLLLVAEKKENNLNTSKTYIYADKKFTIKEDNKLRRLIQTVLPMTNKLR